MTERGLTLSDMVERTLLEKKVVEAILFGRYTVSPDQRRKLADVLGVEPEQIACGHWTEIAHVYGHGPQFGRSP
jgi:transcriptional regulator with XRE-family HTH domain